MYKNIIFDLGGVMVDFDPKTYLVDRFCNAEVEEQVSQLTFESEAWKLLDAGLITRSEANLRMLARAKNMAARLRCRACWTIGCISSAPAAGCRSWCGNSRAVATVSTT